MKHLKLYVALLKRRLDLPRTPISAHDRSLEETFNREIEDHPDPSKRVRLSVDHRSRLRKVRLGNDVKINAYELQRALGKVTKSARRGRSTKNLGLLFADSWDGHPGVLGMMFDPGFYLPELPTTRTRYHDVPREGCAVFLDAIKGVRPEDDTYGDETFFTAVHEIGHVFNLWHEEAPKGYMSSSGAEIYPEEAFEFSPTHQPFLRQCGSSDFVHPGGSRFGERGSLGPSDVEFTNLPTDRQLNLQINMAQREFWKHEPVELDIELSLKTKVKKSINIPDRLDPGYDEFVLWLTQPNGERLRYRPPRFYCGNSRTRTIDERNPFRRDLSVFLQTGGHTFSSPGRYAIQAMFHADRNSTIKSNVVEVNVKRSEATSDRFIEEENFLCRHNVMKLLYHRDAPMSEKLKLNVTEFIRQCRRPELQANICYASGRWLARRADNARGDRKTRYTSSARELLRQATDCESLSPQRRQRCDTMLETL